MPLICFTLISNRDTSYHRICPSIYLKNHLAMNRIFLLTIICLFCMNLNGQNLEQHRWKNRIVIIKTKKEQSEKYQKQLKEFGNSNEAFRDRKLVLYQVVDDQYKLTDFKNIARKESEKISLNLRESLLIPIEQFEVILIGLDGGIKLQTTAMLSKEDLFNKIDAMPMRRAELRKLENQ